MSIQIVCSLLVGTDFVIFFSSVLYMFWLLSKKTADKYFLSVMVSLDWLNASVLTKLPILTYHLTIDLREFRKSLAIPIFPSIPFSMFAQRSVQVTSKSNIFELILYTEMMVKFHFVKCRFHVSWLPLL